MAESTFLTRFFSGQGVWLRLRNPAVALELVDQHLITISLDGINIEPSTELDGFTIPYLLGHKILLTDKTARAIR
jgi:hypothetical protein